MTEDEAFLQDILASPDDDAPRLVYADWLEDHGDPDRAAFIRVQCELAKLEEWNERWDGLKEREQRALRGCCKEWLGGVERLVHKWQFRRGFLDSADVRPKDLVASGEELFRRVPLRHVRLSGNFGEPAVRALAASPHLAKVRSLELGFDRLTSAGAAALAGSPCLRGLRELKLFYCWIGAEGVRALAASPHLARLTTLRLPFCDIGTAGAVALAASPHLARLERLDLQDNDIRNEGARALARSPHLTHLTDLNLGSNRLSVAAVQALAESPTLRPSRLDLCGNMLGEKGARALVGPPGGARLTGLRFDCLGSPGVKALARSPRLANLTALDLSFGHFGDDGARALAASPHLARLVELSLYLCGVSDAGAQAVLGSPHLTRLRRVDLRRNELGRKQKALWRARLGKNVSF